MDKKNKQNNNTALPFILVSDKIIAERLKESGFVCINEANAMYTFLNNGKLVFADEQGIVYSNKLCI